MNTECMCSGVGKLQVPHGACGPGGPLLSPTRPRNSGLNIRPEGHTLGTFLPILAWGHQGPHCPLFTRKSGQAPRWPLLDAWQGVGFALLGTVVTRVVGFTHAMKSGHILNRQQGLGGCSSKTDLDMRPRRTATLTHLHLRSRALS